MDREFDVEYFHSEKGDFSVNVNKQLKEIITWKILSQFVRRYPDRFRIIETHPCSGQYDCISVYSSSGEHVADFNRNGRLHIFQDDYPKKAADIWQMLVVEQFQDALDLLCHALGLKIPKHRPASTPSVISYRFMSACLSFSCFGYNRYKWVNGILDTSGFDGGVRKEFSRFKDASDHLRRLTEGMSEAAKQFPGHPAYDFWFLLMNDNPVLCVHTEGLVFKYDDQNDLVKMYKKHKRLFPLVVFCMSDFVAIEEE